LDAGDDPRELDRQRETAAEERRKSELAQAEAERIAAITVGTVWTDYLEKRRPYWGELHYRDHVDKSKPGGLPSERRGANNKLTQPGPLASLMTFRLKDLDNTAIEAWAAKEGQLRPASARLAWRLLTVFLNWCSEQPEYEHLLPAKNPGKTRKAREALGKAGTKTDVLQRGQLKVWFDAITLIPNSTVSVALQTLLLTGARLNEIINIQWEDVNFQWKSIHINDKVEGARDIPLTPYVEQLIRALPRRNEWVFSSPTSASGRLAEPNTAHTRACRSVGLEGLTLHGLRRSFKSLTEWLEVPVGVVAQIQGHKPSATAEKHYTVRPLELLAVHHHNIEKWMLEQAQRP
jgi:integrase